MSEATKQNIDEGTEENMLVSWFEARFGFLKPHYKTIAIVAGLLVLAVILFMFLQKMKRDNYASQWLGFNQSFCNTLMDGKPSHLTDLADQFPDAVSSNWAMQIAGDITLSDGLSTLATDRDSAMKKLKKAKAHYQAVVDSKVKKTPMLERRSVFGLAYALESLGEFDQAREYYAQLVESNDPVFADAAQRGLSRSKDSNLANFYADFESAKMGMAPGVRLANRPDIEFPEFDLPEGEAVAGPQFLNGSANPEDSPEATEPEATEPEATEPEATEPEATETEATETEATGPEAATDPEVTEPEVMPEEAGDEDN